MSRLRTTARIHLLAARDKPYCVVLRRKPSRWVHVMLWNTNSGRVEEGSWFHGRIYTEWCDISPDGQWLYYFAAGHRSYPTWAGISLPPWLKVHLHWESAGTYGLPAVWAASDRLQLGFDWDNPGDWSGYLGPTQSPEMQAERIKKLPFTLEKLEPQIPSIPGSTSLRLRRDGYREIELGVFARQPTKEHPVLTVRYAGYFSNSGHRFSFALSGFGPDLSRVDWACWDAKDRLLVATDGRLERYGLEALRKGQPDFAADLEYIEVPEDRRRHSPKTVV